MDSVGEAFRIEIFYLVAVPDWQPNQATPTAGFSYELTRSVGLLRAIAHLPSNIYELSPQFHAGRLAGRMCGTQPLQVFGQSPRAIMSQPVPAETPFTVIVLGPGQDAKPYLKWMESCPVPPVLVAEKDGTLSYEAFTLKGLRDALLTVCDKMAAHLPAEAVEDARQAISTWEEPSGGKLGYAVGGHATITPNLMALTVAGFESPVEGPFREAHKGNQAYVDQIALTTRSVLKVRADTQAALPERSFPRTPELSLFAPAVFPSTAQLGPPPDANQEERRDFQNAKNLILRQRGYGYAINTDAQNRAFMGMSVEEAKSQTGNFKPHFLMQLRQHELWLSTSMMELLAASEISAVVRPPNDVNRAASSVRQFANHYRANNRSASQTLSDFRAVQTRLSDAVPSGIFDLIREAGDTIRVVADAHLEWLDIDGLPLCLRKNVSRVPVTPGNLFVEQMGPKPILRILPDNFRRVLVISALRRADPIRGMFERAFREFGKHWKEKIDVTFVEVGSEQELVDALNAFDGAIAVFDGHGRHEAGKPAVLALKDEECDVWSLRPRIDRPPPIMILSACDTHAADRNHATTANGFLAMGCRTVLASVFPLEAINAATFAARLLYRISTFVPAMINARGGAMTWTELCSGMVRMQAATDLRHELGRKRLITHDQVMELGEASNVAINMQPGDPFETILKKMIELGLDEKRARRELRMAVAGSSAISYLQMGRPETILFDTPERLAKAAAEESGDTA